MRNFLVFDGQKVLITCLADLLDQLVFKILLSIVDKFLKALFKQQVVFDPTF